MIRILVVFVMKKNLIFDIFELCLMIFYKIKDLRWTNFKVKFYIVW